MKQHLAFVEAQDLLLANLPTRQQLMKIKLPKGDQQVHIRVERTLPFEFIQNVMPAFTRLWSTDVFFQLSSYDATFSALDEQQDQEQKLPVDAIILWIDWRLYFHAMTPEHAAEWLEQRLQTIRKQTNMPVLINNWPLSWQVEYSLFHDRPALFAWAQNLNKHIMKTIHSSNSCYLIDLAYYALQLGESFFDERNETLSQYPFSNKATLQIARHIAVHLLPAVLHPRLKAIVLDLDDTLYLGVLGEEGSEGVVLTEGHHRLQQLLLKLQESGMMLALCSRNELEDVQKLFHQRTDFPLTLQHFSVIYANWSDKSNNLLQIAKKMNIDPSAIVFLDDNPSELLKAAYTIPALHILRADRDGAKTMLKLCHYPGCYQLIEDGTAHLRTADIQANQVREKLQKQATNYTSYLEGLGMVLQIHVNDRLHTDRIYEMSHKTNQFNLALRRMSLSEVNEVINSPSHIVMTVHLSDRLSDSGIIGVYVCTVNGEKAHLQEVLFSCRALGREIETVSFERLLRLLYSKNVKQLTVDVKKGPRNEPAHKWMHRFIQDSNKPQLVDELLTLVQKACVDYPIKVEEMT